MKSISVLFRLCFLLLCHLLSVDSLTVRSERKKDILSSIAPVRSKGARRHPLDVSKSLFYTFSLLKHPLHNIKVILLIWS